MQLQIRNLSFTYDGAYTPVFTNATVNLDTKWRLALVGRNGRGKTTLLRLLQRELPFEGVIDMPLPAAYFPYPVADESQLTLFVLQAAAPDTPDWKLLRELKLLRVSEDVLYQPFSTLSKGEQTKVLLCALFARDDVYPLIDEPTNHLDLHGRALVAEYLRRKDGFLLVSHDRDFLNRCVDHVMSINKQDIWVMQGDFDAWQARLTLQNETELARNEVLHQDIKRLQASARRAAEWSAKAEKGKFHVPDSEVSVVDRGYVGSRSAAMMKRSMNTVKRKERAIDEKSELLHNLEKTGDLKLTVLEPPKRVLIRVQDAQVRYGERTVCEHITFTVEKGDRVALTGANGAGKSSILKTLCGLSDALLGDVRVSTGLAISYVPQATDALCGSLREHILRNGLDETLFKAILRNMDMGREHFDQDLSVLSQGQKKKILLAQSLCTPAHLYVWDEPLNYIDVWSRKQVEDLILRFSPTLLMVEHDRAFLENVATKEICLDA